MTVVDCTHEQELVQAVLDGRLDGSPALTRHLETCESCRDVVALTRLFRDDRERALADVQLPVAGQVWWRAAIRARLDAAHAAARPMTWAHGVAAAAAAGVTASVIGFAWPTISRGAAWFGQQMVADHLATQAMADVAMAMMQRTLPLALAAAFVVLAPVALFLALSDGKR